MGLDELLEQQQRRDNKKPDAPPPWQRRSTTTTTTYAPPPGATLTAANAALAAATGGTTTSTPSGTSSGAFSGFSVPGTGITINLPSGGSGQVNVPLNVPGSYSSSDRNSADHEFLALSLVDALGISKTQANKYVNDTAYQFFLSNHRWPSAYELSAMPAWFDGAQRLTTNLDMLPPYFQTEDGTWWNSGLGSLVSTSGLDSSEAAFLTQVQGAGIVTPFILEQLSETGTVPDIPFIPNAILQQILNPTRFASGGGVGRGSGAARDIVFDRAEVIEAIRDQWRNLLLEEPDNLEALASEYIDNAKQFAREGGNRNLAVWTKGKARETSRYTMLYQKKPEDLAEEQYLGQYVGAASQFGLNQRNRIQEIEAGASSGAGLAGFTERVSRSRPVSTANQGRLSQSLAQTIGNLGALARS